MTEKTLLCDLSKLEKAITKWLAYGERETDSSMKKVYCKDANDLNKIADAIRAGERKQAARLIYNLDTIVRDQIPARLYNEIMKHF